jgi:hypothetical protein
MTTDNLEYSQLVNLLKKSDPKDVYEELVKKEDRVLETIDRVINYSNEKEIKSQEFTSMSLNDIIHKTFWNWRLMINDMYGISTFQDLKKALLKDDRKIYLGILLVLVCVFLFFITIST